MSDPEDVETDLAPAEERALEHAQHPDENDSLEYSRSWVAQNAREGVVCPCCGQYAKVYRRKLNSSMAYVLILIWRQQLGRCPDCSSRLVLDGKDSVVCPDERCEHRGGLGWLHVPSFLAGQRLPPRVLAAIRGDWGKLKYWGLLEEKPTVRDDGSKHAGYYRITPTGVDFVKNRIVVPKYAYFYSGVLKKEIQVNESVDIQTALSDSFKYDELMST